jgi:LCP family protein required for cell wall assembly
MGAKGEDVSQASAQKQPLPIARHGQLPRRSNLGGLAKLVAASLAVVLVSSVAVGAVTVSQLEGNIDSVALVGEQTGLVPALGSYEGGFNILIVGSDKCEEASGCGGRGSANLNDVNILVHVSEDQSNATAVSFPRDLVVPIPSCPREDGKGKSAAMSAQPINVALSYGGLPCVVVAVEALTGLDIPFAAMITFRGVVQMSSAVGGVTVCTTGPVIDKYSGINIPGAGDWELEGHSALAFLRSRHGVGDGSDLGRISSQQVFMSALVRKVTSEGVLENPVNLYRIATAATQSMTLSNSMKNVTTLASMAGVFKNMDLSNITFVQYPSTTGVGGVYENKVAPITGTATALFKKIAADEPFSADKTGRGSVVSPDAAATPTPNASAAPIPEATASPTPDASVAPEVTAPPVIPGLLGQSAADQTCAKAN